MYKITKRIQYLWSELCRRKTIRTAIACLIVFAAVVGPAVDILGGLGAPDWILRLLIYSLIAVFPFVLLVSWSFDITLHGFERTKPIEVGETPKKLYLVADSDEIMLNPSELVNSSNTVTAVIDSNGEEHLVHLTVILLSDDQLKLHNASTPYLKL